ncbi:MAG: hypothetical protein N4A49_01790 [Marinifilaceae bacterium]|jgi:hypothetical protein|nr:hypothetical protein [Marinifilaceae bacterium]
MAEKENIKKTDKKLVLPEGVTNAMFAAWKERYGQKKVKVATLYLDDEETETMDIVIRVPDRNTMGEFEKWIDKSPNKAKEILIKACVLSDKTFILENDDAFFAAFSAAAELIPVRKAIIKN